MTFPLSLDGGCCVREAMTINLTPNMIVCTLAEAMILKRRLSSPSRVDGEVGLIFVPLSFMLFEQSLQKPLNKREIAVPCMYGRVRGCYDYMYPPFHSYAKRSLSLNFPALSIRR